MNDKIEIDGMEIVTCDGIEIKDKEVKIALAIVGSRTMSNEHRDIFHETMKEFIVRYGVPDLVVSGGAKGADTIGEGYAKKHGITTKIFTPVWRPMDPKTGKRYYDPNAGKTRNTDIVNACTHMVAFPSKKGSGTQDSIKKANERGIPIIVKWI